MNVLVAMLFVWVILATAAMSIMLTMVATLLIRKNGLADIDVTNLMMAETCVFAGALIIVLLALRGGI